MDAVLSRLVNSKPQLKVFQLFIVKLLPTYLDSEEGRYAIEELFGLFEDGQDLSTEEKVEHLIQAFKTMSIEKIRQMILTLYTPKSKKTHAMKTYKQPVSIRVGGKQTRKHNMHGGQVMEILYVILALGMVYFCSLAILNDRQRAEQQQREYDRHLQETGGQVFGQLAATVGSKLVGRRQGDRLGHVVQSLLVPLGHRSSRVKNAVRVVGEFANNNPDLVFVARSMLEMFQGSNNSANRSVAAPATASAPSAPAVPNRSAVASAPSAPAVPNRSVAAPSALSVPNRSVAAPSASVALLPAPAPSAEPSINRRPMSSVQNRIKAFEQKKTK